MVTSDNPVRTTNTLCRKEISFAAAAEEEEEEEEEEEWGSL